MTVKKVATGAWYALLGVVGLALAGATLLLVGALAVMVVAGLGTQGSLELGEILANGGWVVLLILAVVGAILWYGRERP